MAHMPRHPVPVTEAQLAVAGVLARLDHRVDAGAGETLLERGEHVLAAGGDAAGAQADADLDVGHRPDGRAGERVFSQSRSRSLASSPSAVVTEAGRQPPVAAARLPPASYLAAELLDARRPPCPGVSLP